MTSRKSIALESIGDFWCEAAVLVAVFGLLDKIMKDQVPTVEWAMAVMGSAILFVGAGIFFKSLAKS